jgi:hypothetical protein
MRLAVVFGLMMLIASAEARCIHRTTYLVEIEMASCDDSLPKLYPSMQRGAVVRAFVFGQVEFGPSARRDDPQTTWEVRRFQPPQSREYWYFSDDPDVCPNLSRQGRVVLWEGAPCCEGAFPVDRPTCDRLSLQALPEWLSKLLADGA